MERAVREELRRRVDAAVRARLPRCEGCGGPVVSDEPTSFCGRRCTRAAAHAWTRAQLSLDVAA